MTHKFDVTARKKLNSEERRKLLSPRETLIRLGYGLAGISAFLYHVLANLKMMVKY